MPPQYIFQIENLSKSHGKKEVLSNIWLAFYPGAKIGVLGANGSGKSTLLRIMAGVETDYVGTARPAAGHVRVMWPLRPDQAPFRRVEGLLRPHQPVRQLLPREQVAGAYPALGSWSAGVDVAYEQPGDRRQPYSSALRERDRGAVDYQTEAWS